MRGNLDQVKTSQFEAKAVRQPVMTFPSGNVRTRVWANPTLWGDVTWAVDQVRIQVREGEPVETKTFGVTDLSDARWGFCLAERYIKKVERRRRLLRFAFWIK